MFGDYTYLTEGYYHSLDGELAGIKIKPTMEEILDAYVVPLAMKKAEQAGIMVPKYETVTEYETVTDEISSQVLVYAVNPFSTKYALTNNQEERKTAIKALTMGGKYAVLCQYVPRNFQIITLRSVLGQSTNNKFQKFVERVFHVFQLPLMRVMVIIKEEEYFFSSIKPLSLKELDNQERSWLEAVGQWQE